ncbi:MAG: RHS repeat-associated core domain-containing protein [Bacteroidia bacterium]|nr:RHS repeat-associated core domain-containing protein [Bacteroidia bacterium]
MGLIQLCHLPLKLHRITVLRAYQQANLETTNSWANPSVMTAYQSNFTYDGNGNILKLKRNGNSPANMDDLTYHYSTGTNRLTYVDDSKPAGNYSVDIDDQSAGNYTHDALDNLTKDNQAAITDISWNHSNKIRKITFTAASGKPALEFRYDPMGNRIVKIVKSGDKEDEWHYTYYARDATGQIMAVYEKTYLNPEYVSDPGWPGVEWLPAGGEYLTLFRSAEYHLYGSSRLGLHLYVDTLKAQVFRTGSVAFTPEGYWLDTTHLTPALPIPYFAPPEDVTYFHTLTRGEKRYELTNHLGNVLSTVSDRKLQLTDDGETVSGYTADVWGVNDYAQRHPFRDYAFGMLMPGRNQRRGGYRFGFQGKESDGEIYGAGNSLDFGARVYDSRVGRWWSVDALTDSYVSWSPFNFVLGNPLRLIDPTGNSVEEGWYTDWDGILVYDPQVKNQNDLSDGQFYEGETVTRKTASGTENYQVDGSIFFTNETAAYNRIWTFAHKTNKENMAVMFSNGVLVLPSYLNKYDESKYQEYGYDFSVEKGFVYLSDSEKTAHKTIWAAHGYIDEMGTPRTTNWAWKPYFTRENLLEGKLKLIPILKAFKP